MASMMRRLGKGRDFKRVTGLMLVLRAMGDTVMRRSMHILLVAAVPVLLTACESSKDVVDTVNPVKWFEGSDADKAAENTEPNWEQCAHRLQLLAS